MKKYERKETWVLLKQGHNYKIQEDFKKWYFEENEFGKPTKNKPHVLKVFYGNKKDLLHEITLADCINGATLHILNRENDDVKHRPMTIQQLYDNFA